MKTIKIISIVMLLAAASCAGNEIVPLDIPPAVTVRLTVPGTAPEDMGEKIADPVERQILVIEGVTGTLSSCETGACEIIVTFADPALLDGIIFEVNAAVRRLLPSLPKGAQFTVFAGSRQRNPDLTIAIVLTEPLTEQNQRIVLDFAHLTMQCPAAAQYEILGRPTMETVIAVDPKKSAAMKVNAADVAEILKKRTIVIDEYTSTIIRTRADEREIADIVVGNLDGTPIRVRDVADVTKEFRQELTYRFDGRPAVLVNIFLRPGSMPEEAEECLEQIISQPRPEIIKRVVNLRR